MPENASHTPGPWEAIPAKNEYGEPTISIRGDGQFIATMNTVSIDGAEFSLPPEGAANARLIAAAPDLLAACKALLNFARSVRPGGGVLAGEEMMFREAAAAIARATGNSQDAAYDAHAAALAARYPVADAAAEAARAAPADGMVCKIPMPSGRRTCDALPLDDCPCRSAPAGEGGGAGMKVGAPTPAPGTDATTADGRFVSGSGYGGERM